MKSKLQHAVELEQETLQNLKIASGLDFLGQHNRSADFHVAATTCDEATRQVMDYQVLPSMLCGEVVPSEIERSDQVGGWSIRNTLASPDTASIQASMDRTKLLSQGSSEVLALGIDAAQSADCDNSLEKMLAHQMALAHSTAFKVIDEAMRQRDTAGMTRLLNAASRLMATYQQALLALHRIRNGGNQTVTVQHVTVNGGQTVVAGSVVPGGSAAVQPGEKK